MKPIHWRLAGPAVAVLVLVAAWFLVISPQRSKAAELNAAREDQLAASAILSAKIALLKRQSEELPQQEAKLAAIEARLPGTAAIPSLIRTLTKVSRAAGVTVASMTPGEPAAVSVAAPAAPQPTASPTATDPAASDQAAPAARSASSAAQVMAIPLAISACGTYAQLRDYLGKLESMQRAVLVTGLSLSKGTCGDSGAQDQGNQLTATITADVFTLPVTTPAPSATPTPGGGS